LTAENEAPSNAAPARSGQVNLGYCEQSVERNNTTQYSYYVRAMQDQLAMSKGRYGHCYYRAMSVYATNLARYADKDCSEFLGEMSRSLAQQEADFINVHEGTTKEELPFECPWE